MIEELFEHYRKITGGDAGAAATLVLAHVNSEKTGMPDSSVYTVSQAAERLGVSRTTVENMLNDGRLTCLRIGRSIRIRKDALEEYMRGTGSKPQSGLFGRMKKHA